MPDSPCGDCHIAILATKLDPSSTTRTRGTYRTTVAGWRATVSCAISLTRQYVKSDRRVREPANCWAMGAARGWLDSHKIVNGSSPTRRKTESSLWPTLTAHISSFQLRIGCASVGRSSFPSRSEGCPPLRHNAFSRRSNLRNSQKCPVLNKGVPRGQPESVAGFGRPYAQTASNDQRSPLRNRDL